MLQLKTLLVDMKSVWIDFPGLKGFEVEVAMLSRKELTRLRKDSTITKYDRKARVPLEELDEYLFVELFTKATIKNWKGLTLKHLETLALVELGENPEDALLEWGPENAEYLVSNSTEFDTWLNEVVFDLDNFRT
jgi:hypothetical protein